jgi:hypothetical protein
VGVQIASLEDGQVVALPDVDDEKVRAKIEKKLGVPVKEQLKTYIQFISNDNY